MIKFIVAEEKQEKQLTLRDVKEDQFFVDSEGRLSQKVGENSFNTIADYDGEPLACETYFWNSDMLIKRILPKVKRIEF
jgi:hypothetical protein